MTMVQDCCRLAYRTSERLRMSERHRSAGRIGGLQTYLRFGSGHMREIAHRGGRPTRQEAAEKAWEIQKTRQKRAERHGHHKRR